MPVTIEFYGIARQRAQVAHLDVTAQTFGEALDQVAERLPQWADNCLSNGRLTSNFLANRNGQEFVSDRDEPLREGDSLLILSADVGG